jgi:hypothetical protein
MWPVGTDAPLSVGSTDGRNTPGVVSKHALGDSPHEAVSESAQRLYWLLFFGNAFYFRSFPGFSGRFRRFC